MKTKLITTKGQIALVLFDPAKPRREQNRVGLMTLYEGTGCWAVEDIRLSQHRTPNPYFGQVADDFHANHKPASEAEATFIKSLLREYVEEPDGTLVWCTFDGIVRGPLRQPEHGWLNSASGYFRRTEALAKLKEMQAFWDSFEGDPATVRLPHPDRQPSSTSVAFRWYMQQEKPPVPA